MILYRLTWHPNGHFDAERIQTDDIDQQLTSPFEPLFDGGPSFNSSMPHADEVAVKWTGSEYGQALFTCTYRGRPFHSGVLVAGADAAGDAELLQMFIRSMEAVPLFRQLTGVRPDPCAPLLRRPERPLLGGVVWPVLTSEKYEELTGLDLLLSTAFLQRFGPK